MVILIMSNEKQSNSMATYKQIQEDIKETTGKSVKSCWIAHVKELNGLPLKEASNRKSQDERVYPCPDEYRDIIENSMRKFNML